MKVYIAGAMTGKFKYREDFARGENYVKGLGHIALNPSFLPEGLADYFEINKAMIDQCDAIFVLMGSENSVGTQKELKYAKSKGWSKENGKIIFEEDTPPPVRYLGEVNNYWGGQYKSNWKWVNPFGV